MLFGATGYTGRLVAEVLLNKRPSLRWGLAGRSRDKLERVRADLAAIDPAAADLPLLIGDSLDPASVDALVRRARVVCTTVGPYARYGAPLVAACAARGVHYCDLTGEPHFVRAAVDAHHARAVETGARIVPCCGFDSIPSDLGVLMLHEHLRARSEQLAEAHYRVVRMKGGPSGGTVASVLDVVAAMREPGRAQGPHGPLRPRPGGHPARPRRARRLRPRAATPTPATSPAPSSWPAINTRIVRRSNALLGFPYGKGFRYDEAVDTGPGPAGLLRAGGLTAGVAGIGALGRSPPPSPRAAPSSPASSPRRARARPASSASAAASASRSTPPPPPAQRLTGVVAASRDPGYGATSIMLAESALSLAEDPLPERGGVLTTASAMGMHLVERLRRAGMTFRVEG